MEKSTHAFSLVSALGGGVQQNSRRRLAALVLAAALELGAGFREAYAKDGDEARTRHRPLAMGISVPLPPPS